MKFTLFDSDGYRLNIVDFRLTGSFLSPALLLDGEMVDPEGNGMLIQGVQVSIHQIKALLAFFQSPDNADLAAEAKKAAQDGFTDSIKGLMAAAKG